MKKNTAKLDKNADKIPKEGAGAGAGEEPEWDWTLILNFWPNSQWLPTMQ